MTLTTLKRHKDIILYRTIAGIKSEGRQNYLGYIWFLFEPILSTAVLYFAWSQVTGSKGFNAILTILIGMVTWTWFESSVMNGSAAIKAKFHVLNQFALPKYIFPIVSILVTSWKSMFVFGVILILSIGGGLLNKHFLWLPLIMLVQFILIVGITLPISIIVTLMNDLNTVISSIFRLFFFISGVFFTGAQIKERCLANNDFNLYDVYYWNPVAVLIDSYRAVIQDGCAPAMDLLFRAAIIAFGFLSLGLLLNAYYDKRILKLTNV